jgi:hypothetical protein
MDSSSALVGGVTAVPLIIGLVAAIRQVGLPDRFAPLVSIALGVLMGITGAYLTGPMTPQSLVTGVIVGLGLGLAASGAYSGTKATLGK